MSIIYSNTGKYEESLKSVKQALGIDPGLSAAKSHLEMVEVLLKTQPADGINTPADVITLTTRGVGLQNSGDNAGAENLL